MRPVLFYDGECALCAWIVRFVLRHDRQRTLRFAGLEGSFARTVLARHRGLQGLDTVVWYEPAGKGRPERLLTRSEAVLEVLRYVGGAWRLALVAAAIPPPLRDAAYRLFARHRRHLFGRVDSCALPPDAERNRFLD